MAHRHGGRTIEVAQWDGAAAPTLSWITERLFLGAGLRLPDSVHIRLFEVG